MVQSDADSDMLALMRDIPAESTVLVEGIVHERPTSQKRPVSLGASIQHRHPRRILSILMPIVLIYSIRVAILKWPSLLSPSLIRRKGTCPFLHLTPET